MDRPSEPIHGPAEHIHRPHHRLRQNAMLLLLLMEMGYAQRSNAGTPKDFAALFVCTWSCKHSDMLMNLTNHPCILRPCPKARVSR